MSLSPAERPTEVLILGSAHLTTLTPGSALRRTLERLEGWRLDMVGVELLPGELVDLYRQEGIAPAELAVGGYPQALHLETLARAHRPWSRAEAVQIAHDPGTGAGDRVLAWLLALEPANALLHLSPALRLPEELAEVLEAFGRGGEVRRLALPLAWALGHSHIAHLDDHTGLEIYTENEAELERLWNDPTFRQTVQQHPSLTESQQAMHEAAAADDYWLYLRHANGPAAVASNADLETGTYLRSEWSGQAHRARVAQWDTRNLFMAARVRRASACVPGGKLLVIVGASHKGPIEQALVALAPDLRLVALEELEV